MGPIKSSQFAELWLGGEKLVDNEVFQAKTTDLAEMDTAVKEMDLVKAGVVTSLRIQENLNSAQRNVIGTPVPIFMPGYYSATITADKATLDLRSFKNMVNINPMSAFRTDTYKGGVNKVSLPQDILTLTGAGSGSVQSKLPRFVFLLAVKDLIAGAGSSTSSNTDTGNGNNTPAPVTNGEINTNVGLYVCMLQSFNVTIASDNSVIMESITMLARPIAGSWFSALATTYELSPGFGYDPTIKPLITDSSKNKPDKKLPGQ